MTKALFVADTHLDLQTWASRPGIRRDAISAFDWVISYACDNDIWEIIAAGDLIDVKKPPAEVAEYVRQSMDRLAAAKISFYYIQGQHEYSKTIPWFSAVHSWPVWINEKQVELDDSTRVQGFDWTSADLILEKLETVEDDTDILVMHQVWEEFMGAIRGCECSFSQVPNVSTLFTGDYHETREYEAIGASGQALHVISPGSTHLRKIDEPTDKYCYLYEDGEWTPVKIPTRPRIDVTINDEDDMDAFADNWPARLEKAKKQAATLPAALQTPLCWVQYKDTVDDVKARTSKVAGATAELFYRRRTVDSDSATAIDKADRDEVVGAGLVGCLPLLVPSDSDDHKALLRLLESTDAAVELQKMKTERGL